jgi:hypothetical protein
MRKTVIMRTTSAGRFGGISASLIAAVGVLSGSSLAGDDDCGWSERFGIAGVSAYADSLAVAPFEPGGEVFVSGSFWAAGVQQVRGAARWSDSVWRDASAPIVSGCERLRKVRTLNLNGQRSVYAEIQGTGESCTGTVAAVWDQGSWSYLGEPLSRYGNIALCVHDDGQGEQLFAGIDYFGTSVSAVVRWDGGEWRDVGGAQFDADNHIVRELASLGDGANARLYALGEFRNQGFHTGRVLAEWDGEAWTILPLVSDYTPLDLAVVQSGVARGVYLSGQFVIGGEMRSILQYDGATFTALPGPNTGWARLETLEFNGAERLFAHGDFSSIGGVPADRIAWWDGVTWHALSPSFSGGAHEIVAALAAWPGESGDRIVASGVFGQIGGVRADNIAVYDAGVWRSFGQVRDGLAGGVVFATVSPDQWGESFYCAGQFRGAGSAEASHLARFDGTSWHAVPLPTDDGAYGPLHVADTGTGLALHMSGGFILPGEHDYRLLLRWDGAGAWTPVETPRIDFVYDLQTALSQNGAKSFLAGGMIGEDDEFTEVVFEFANGQWRDLRLPEIPMARYTHALTSAWRGDSPDGGYVVVRRAERDDFSLRGVAHRWDGSEWNALAVPEDWSIYDAAFVRSGPAKGVYLFGGPSTGEPTGNTVLYSNGGDFAPLVQSARPTMWSFGARAGGFDFGDGEALYAVGLFTVPGRVETPAAVARWDGIEWSLLAPTVDGLPLEITKYRDRLLVSGYLTGSPDAPSGAIGSLGCIVRPCPTDITADGATGMDDLVRVLGRWSELAIGEPEDIDRDGVVTLADLAELITHWDERCP